MRSEDTVFGDQRHEVGDRPQSRQIEVILHLNLCATFVSCETQHLKEAMHEFKDEASGTERLPSRLGGIIYARVN